MSVKALAKKKSTAGALPTLSELAARANDEHAAFHAAADTALTHALRAGDLLIEAKQAVDHGDWSEWVAGNCNFSLRAAQQYMQLAKNRAALEAKSAQRALLPTITEARKLIAGPPRPKAKPIEAEAPCDLPDLSAGGIYFATGMSDKYPAIIQIEESLEHPGFWHVEGWHLHSDQTVLTMRPVRLTSTCPERISDREWFAMATAMEFHSGPFVQRGEWKRCDRENPAITLIPESVRARAVRILNVERDAESFAQALDMAMREVA